jgi:hypothetical protein
MKNKYKVSERNGQPAIFTDRGIVCLMEAGYQSTRERDAAEIVTILNAAPELLAALKLVYANAGESPEWIRARIGSVISKAEGVK